MQKNCKKYVLEVVISEEVGSLGRDKIGFSPDGNSISK